MLVAVLIVVVVIAGVYLYVHGTGSHSGSIPDTSGAQQQAQDFWSTIQHDPHFYLAAASAILATLAIMTWRRIGGWGRGALLVLAGVAFALVFAKGGK